MDAMIFAAGLGTRLGGLTQDTPKALIDVAGVPALERVARRLIDAGADRLIINVHHHASRIERFVQERNAFGVEVCFSPEPDGPLETGGGLLRAAPLFRRAAPFLLHNVDVLTDADLRALCAAHDARRADVTLAVSRRATARQLLFDEAGLCGRWNAHSDVRVEARACADARPWAFGGIHVVSPAVLDLITERGAFSILEAYLRLCTAGVRILAHDIGPAHWHEIGTPERLAAARRALAG